MFGTIRPCLQKDEKSEYKCYYCGLCMGMGKFTGFFSRFLLNYDFCIAYLVADSISTDTQLDTAICPFPFWRKVRYRFNSRLLRFMAERNYILTYHKVLDDIHDDGSFIAKILERLMRRRYLTIMKEKSALIESVTATMDSLHTMELANANIPIAEAAKPFGELMRCVMDGCMDDSTDSMIFAQLCRYLGMWIYTIDACKDIHKDSKKGKYNPILAGRNSSVENVVSERKEEISKFLMHCKLSMMQLLELLHCAKNKELVYSIFEHALPRDVAEMLQ